MVPPTTTTTAALDIEAPTQLPRPTSSSSSSSRRKRPLSQAGVLGTSSKSVSAGPINAHSRRSRVEQSSASAPTSSTSTSIIAKLIRTKNAALANLTRKRLPILGRTIDKIHASSPRVRALLFLLLVVQKFVMTFVVFPLVFRYLFIRSSKSVLGRNSRRMMVQQSVQIENPIQLQQQQKLRVLYLLTQPSSQRDHRSVDTLISALGRDVNDGVHGLIQTFGHVLDLDLYLNLGYALPAGEKNRIQIPSGVGLQIWDEEVDPQDGPHDVLAKRHALVLKDKLLGYDLFISSYLPTAIDEQGNPNAMIVGPRHFWIYVREVASHDDDAEDMRKASQRRIRSEHIARNGSSALLNEWGGSTPPPVGNFDAMVFSDRSSSKDATSRPRSWGWIASQSQLVTIFGTKCSGADTNMLLVDLRGVNKEASGCQRNITVTNSIM